MHKYFAILFSLSIVTPVFAQHVQVLDLPDQNKIILKNSDIEVHFSKNNASISKLLNQNGINLLGPKGAAYLLGPGFSMANSTCKIVRQEKDLVELSFYHEADNHFQYSLHYVLRSNLSGIYCFLIQSHRSMDSTGDYGQTRWGLRADENLFDYHWVRDSIQGPMPKMSALTNPIQDWTFQLQDSSFYTKYDYADYIEGRHVHGMAGARSGLGLFVIQASHDYLNGGPTKQYQNVHSDPFLICMFNCGHFQSDKRVGDNKISKDWIKLNGPFLLYANQGSDVNAVWKDAKKRTEIEMAQWPYQWMKNDFYPLIRSSVSGTLLMNNIPVLNNTQIVLADTGHDWQAQSNGYMYAARTEAGGKFLLNSVRPGFYKLYAYGNNSLEEFKGPDLIIRENEDLNLGSVKWKSDTSWKKIWQLGQADRTTKGFKWADHKRTYDLFKKTPENLSFLIGKSKEAEDWFYAQTKNGIWEILFDLNEGALHLDSVKLTIAFAGASRNPQLQILLNGQWVGSISDLGNDASIYRSAIAGGYYQTRQLVLKANTLIKGQNSLQLKLVNPKPGAGVMYDALLMSSR